MTFKFSPALNSSPGLSAPGRKTRNSSKSKLQVSPAHTPLRIIQRVKLVKDRQMSAPTAQGHFQPGGNAPGMGVETTILH